LDDPQCDYLNSNMTEYGSPSTTERVWWGAVVNGNEPLRYSLDYKEIYDTSETGRSRFNESRA